MNHRIYLAALVLLGFSLAGFAQTTNNWTNSVSGSWHDFSWSLGIRPQNTHSIYVANSGSKAVMLNNTTRDVYPGTMTVSNLVLSAPISSTNTLLLNFFGTNVPLNILDSVLIGTNGVLLNLFSGLTASSLNGGLFVHGGTVHQEGGATLVQGLCQVGYDFSSGLYTLTNGFFATHTLDVLSSGFALYKQSGGETRAAEITLGRWGRPGDFLAINGIVRVGDVLVRNGIFDQSNSDVICNGDLVLEPEHHQSSPNYFIRDGGSLTADSISVKGYIDNYNISVGVFTMHSGSVYANQIMQGDFGSIQQNDGTISVRGDVLGGIRLSGGLLMSSNTYLYNPSSFVLTAHYIQSGGTNVTTNLFQVGDDALFTLNAGQLDVGNMELARGGYLQGNGGTITNRGRIIFSGGSMSLAPGQQWFGPIEVRNSPGFSTTSGVSFPAGPCTVQFKNSSSIPWAGTGLLHIYQWNGLTNGSGNHRVIVGVGGLTSTQLEQVFFEDPSGFPPGRYHGILLDNGELVPTTTVKLAGRPSANGLTLLWPGSPALMSATNVAGPYLSVTNAHSPFEVPSIDGPMRFFRLQKP